MPTTTKHSHCVEIDANEIRAVTFSANGEHLVSGGLDGIRIWQVKDGKQVATMTVQDDIFCVVVSKDGKWIAAGSHGDKSVLVWNATTYEQVFTDQGDRPIDVDFSPDSTRLVFALLDGTATIWDLLARRKARTLEHGVGVLAAKYSPQGDRIATATFQSVRVWDCHNGYLLVDVKMNLDPLVSLLWLGSKHLFVKSHDRQVKQIDATTGLTVWESSVPDPGYSPCIALPQHGRFIVYAANKTIIFWDTSTHIQVNLIPQSNDIYPIAFSPDGQLLAMVAKGKIIIKSIFRTPSDPEIDIECSALESWKNGQLMDAETLLTKAIPTSRYTVHHALASRSLVRARLGKWDEALIDAEESIKIHQSVIGYAARCVALVGKGETDEGWQTCDIALQHFHSEHIILLLIIKAITLFMAGRHNNAISRIDDLITGAWVEPELYVVQAYMYLFVGNLHMERGDYERAIQSFKDGQMKLGDHIRPPPLIVSLISGWKFDDLAVTIQQRICEALLAADHTKEAGEFILHMADREVDIAGPIKAWMFDFRSRCSRKLEGLGDDAMNTKRYEEASSQYTAALSLNPAVQQDLLAKRSKAYAEQGKWRDALNDADKVIKLDPSFPSGYERKHAALHGMGRYDDATDAFATMLSKMSESSDPELRERSRRYVWPEQTKKTIRASIKRAIRDSPLVLINVISGRLCRKSEQAAAFESTPAFTSLIASTTTHIDHGLIDQVVGEFYRYVTLSHTWEGDEPLYENVIKIVVYDLEASPTHDKLRMFCAIVREEGFNWAWSDTCCINKADHFVLQEALVSMFKWYEGSAMTVIFLFDVDRLAGPGALIMSTWNSRGWTLQEYHASRVVRIYTRDWTPYLGLTIYNHKEAPEIMSEMERATGISAPALMAIRPGLNDIREKLRLASTRQTMRVEDTAYSLLGIFSISMPVTYGEADKALGRLLSQLLTSSGDACILAWTGTSNSFNSCLPTSIAMFCQPPTSHIPLAITDAEMATITAGLRASSLDLSLATRLYEKLNELPVPFFAGQRMKLPCLAFELGDISGLWKGSELVFRARAAALGTVEIKTRLNLKQLGSLYLVHPWLDFLLDRDAAESRVELALEVSELGDFPSMDSFPESPTTSYEVPFNGAPLPMDTQMHIYGFLARLRRPFGALLLIPSRRNTEYKRIVTECLITAQVGEITPATLDALIRGVRMLDVL